MVSDAEKNGVSWAQLNDERVTVVGRILRKSRIDELPQLWNILNGTMTFVGPRPERPQYVEILSDKLSCYETRHVVKPGLTGWAQINAPYAASVDDSALKLSYDLYYVANGTLSLDIQIALRTIGSVFSGAR